MAVNLLLEAAEFLDSGNRARGETVSDKGSARKPSTSRSESGNGFNFNAATSEQGSPSPNSLSPVSRSDPDDKGICTVKDRRRLLGAGTREVHNKMEKNRRAQLKECFDLLGGLLSVSEGKPSNLNILQNARKEISHLQAEEKRLLKLKEKLKEQHSKRLRYYRDLKRKLNLSSHFAHSPSRPTTIEDDSLSDSTTTASECGEFCSDTDDASEGPSSIDSPLPFQFFMVEKSPANAKCKLDPTVYHHTASSPSPNKNHRRTRELQNVPHDLEDCNEVPNRDCTDNKSKDKVKSLMKNVDPNSCESLNSSNIGLKETVFCNKKIKLNLKNEAEIKLSDISYNFQKQAKNISSEANEGCLPNTPNVFANRSTLRVNEPSVPLCSSNSTMITLNSRCIDSTEAARIPAPAKLKAAVSPSKSPVNVQKSSSFIIPSSDSIPGTVVSDICCIPAGKIPENQKPAMAKRILQTPPTINTIHKTSVISKPPIGQITVGSIPSHITVLRTASNTFTLPAQMLPNGTIQLNSNPTANVITPAQPTLQLLAQPQTAPVKLLQTSTNVGAVLTPTITIMKQSPDRTNIPVATSSSLWGIGTSPISPIGKSLPKSTNGLPCVIPSSPTVISKSPLIQNNLFANSSTKALPTSKITCNLSPPTEPPFTFTKFSFKQQSNSAMPVHKIATNLTNQPQVSVMTVTSQPSGKAFTQILHQTLVQGIPSTVSNIQGNSALPRHVNNINHHSLPVASPVSTSPTPVLSPVARFVPQNISPVGPQGTTILPHGTVITSPGITQVTRALPQATPIMSSYPQHVTAPIPQIVSAPISVVSGPANASNAPQVLSTQSSKGNVVPLQSVGHLPFVNQQCTNNTPVKSLVMVSNVIPPTLDFTAESATIASFTERKMS